MIELLRGHLIVTSVAQVSRVAVDVLAVEGERDDVVYLRSETNDIAIEAAFA